MRGVLLAGGEATRLRALTQGRNKHLLDIGGEPMFHHGLRKLRGAGIHALAVVTGRRHERAFEEALAAAGELAARVTLLVQERAGGVAEAVGLAESFAGDGRFVTLLGDNLFEAPLGPLLRDWEASGEPARVFLKQVDDPARFGLARLEEGRFLGMVEKPARVPSDLAVTGIYGLDPFAFGVIRGLAPSPRGELDVAGVVNAYVHGPGIGHAELPGWWVDAGTPGSFAAAEALLEAHPPRFEA